MTEKQEAQFRKLIAYAHELARQHNEVERRVEQLEARVKTPACGDDKPLKHIP